MEPKFLSAVLWSYPVAFGLVSLIANSYDALYKADEHNNKTLNRRRIARTDKSLLLLHYVLAILLVSIEWLLKSVLLLTWMMDRLSIRVSQHMAP